MAKIVLKGVTKKFGQVTAVDELDLVIPEGSFTTFLGPSGCGKTTTLRMIAGLEMPTAGEVWIGDRCAFSSERGEYLSPGERNLGLVFQSYALWPHMTVFDNISFGLSIAKVSSQEIKKRTQRIADMLQIGDLLQRYPSELSGGQQQRVAIARVLVMEPRVMLLDEPLSNLDARLRMDMRAELKRLHVESGATIIYVTHDQLEALTMSTHVALMHKGVLQQWAGPMEIYHHPANTFTADFIGNPRINFLDARVHAKDGKPVAQVGNWQIPLEEYGVAADKLSNVKTLGIRPEDLYLEDSRDLPYTQGRVYSVLPAGAEWYVQIDLGENEFIIVKTYEDPQVDVDQTVKISVSPSRVKCFDADGNSVLSPDRRKGAA